LDKGPRVRGGYESNESIAADRGTHAPASAGSRVWDRGSCMAEMKCDDTSLWKKDTNESEFEFEFLDGT
jgi:hypothetical protein